MTSNEKKMFELLSELRMFFHMGQLMSINWNDACINFTGKISDLLNEVEQNDQ